MPRNQPSLSDIYSGTYTPTLTDTLNLDSSTANECFYTRIGNVVSVYGLLSIDPTAIGIVNCDISLPISSNIASGDVSGVAVATNRDEHGSIYGVATTDVARLYVDAKVSVSISMRINFSYKII